MAERDKKCTWKDCNNIGVHSQKNKDGYRWALLCDAHHNEMEQSIAALFSEKKLT